MAEKIKKSDINKLKKALTLFKDKKYTGALDIYLELVKTYPENILLLNNLGSVYIHLSKFQKALLWLEKSFKKNVFNKVMLEMTGTNKEKINEFKEKLLLTFWNKFKDELNREPTEQEMIDNLAQDVENSNGIDETIITEFIERMSR